MSDKNWDSIQRRIAGLGNASVQDYCTHCGESPESASHIFNHVYQDPRPVQDRGYVQPRPLPTSVPPGPRLRAGRLTKADVRESFDRVRETDRIISIRRPGQLKFFDRRAALTGVLALVGLLGLLGIFGYLCYLVSR